MFTSETYLSKSIRTIEVKSGETTEIVLENDPVRGNIQIIKKAAEYNDITKDRAGKGLEDAVFEIFDEENDVVDRIETDRRGIAVSNTNSSLKEN